MISFTRPLKLSDPYQDFTSEELNSIIGKDDSELDVTDFICIFQSYLPAGIYRENVYFINVLLTFWEKKLKSNNDVEGLADTVDHFLFWCNSNISLLEHDELVGHILDRLENLLYLGLECFQVPQIEEKQELYPYFASFVSSLIEGIIKYNFLFPLRERVKVLLDPNVFERASWMITICESLKHSHDDSGIVNFFSRQAKCLALKTILNYMYSHWHKSEVAIYWEQKLISMVLIQLTIK